MRRFCGEASAGYVCMAKALAGQVVELAVSFGVKGKTAVSHFRQLSEQDRRTSVNTGQANVRT